jgi:hypothetical protein
MEPGGGTLSGDGETMNITAKTDGGGAVRLNEKDGVWASYRVAGVSGVPASPLFYAGIQLQDGRSMQFFFNRDTNLVVVDVIDKDANGGVEILRRKV